MVEARWLFGIDMDCIYAGHAENERCDELATTAADDKKAHIKDEGFKSDEDGLLL